MWCERENYSVNWRETKIIGEGCKGLLREGETIRSEAEKVRCKAEGKRTEVEGNVWWLRVSVSSESSRWEMSHLVMNEGAKHEKEGKIFHSPWSWASTFCVIMGAHADMGGKHSYRALWHSSRCWQAPLNPSAHLRAAGKICMCSYTQKHTTNPRFQPYQSKLPGHVITKISCMSSTVLLLRLDRRSESNGYLKICQEFKLKSPSDTIYSPPWGRLQISRQLNKCFSA